MVNFVSSEQRDNRPALLATDLSKHGSSRFIAITLLVIIAVVVGVVLQRVGSDSVEIRNIVLISIDTCRADYLSCYGYGRKTTPNIDKLAAEGVLFENAFAPVPITLPSHSSMLTGTIPPYHGVHNNEGYKLAQSNITLAEILKDNGFKTTGIISAHVLKSTFGIDQGFDSYHDQFAGVLENNGIEEREGGETTEVAIKWLNENEDDRFFMFLHYFDPHTKYKPPEPFSSRYITNLYAGEVAYSDYCIGRVIEKLKELDLYNSTLIIVTSDHGEMLGDHGEQTHSYYIYQTAIKVPLVFKLPGQKKAKKIKPVVGLIDIVPTICSLLEIEIPHDIQGVDISGHFGGRNSPEKDRHLYCESFMPTIYNANSLFGVVTDRYKYIQTTRPELYDLVKDPASLKEHVF